MKMEKKIGDICTIWFCLVGVFPPENCTVDLPFQDLTFFGSKTVKKPLRQKYENCVSSILNFTYSEEVLVSDSKANVSSVSDYDLNLLCLVKSVHTEKHAKETIAWQLPPPAHKKISKPCEKPT